MPSTHDRAPAFTVPGFDPDAESVRQFSLAEATTDGPVILVFYPFDFSPVCAEQLCTFRDMEWLTYTETIDVWGISPDSAYSHKQFINEYDLQFPLISDRLGEVADRYGVLLSEFEHHPNVPKRSIIAIDSDRTIRHIWHAESQYDSPDIAAVEATIAWYRQDDADGDIG